ncbi:PKD domain-containing protein, partial [Candidatus Bathyarchaeota archaeon]|nr:PKD domain-containing protein [Candidatus Bathyarchaeota archaeon]
DYTGTILTVDGNDYDYCSLPVSFWWDEGSTHTFTYYSPLVVDPNSKRYVWTSTTGLSNQQSDTITVTTNGTITGNYKTQYYLNLETSPSGITTPSGEGWYDAGATASISTEEIIDSSPGSRYKFVKWTTGDMSEISDPYSASTTVLMDKAKTVTANYVTQYKLTVRTNGLETYVTNVYNGTDVLGTATDATPYTGWFDEGAIIYLNIDSPITDSSERKVFTEWSGDATGTNRPLTITMDSAKDITANYKTQYLIVFTQSGLDDTATGTVVIINSTDYEFTDLPYNIWADEGSTFTYSYQDIVLSSTTGKRFKLVGVSGPTSPFTVTGPITVTGNYKIQYQVTFDQTGLDSSATGTVVTVNGTPLDYSSLPFSQWLDEGTTVTYSYESIVSSTTQGKRFSLSDITGPASPFTVDGPKTIIGNYLTQYYLTVTSPFGTPSGEGWYDAGATAYAGLDTGLIDYGNGTRRIFVSWSGDASGTNYAQSDPIIMDAPKEAVANWQTQHYLTVRVDPPGITTIPGEGWYNESDTVTLTAPDVAAGCQFSYWDVDGVSQGAGVNPIMVTMDVPHVATAHYTAVTPQYTLTIVTTTGGTTDPPPGSYTYDEGTIVSVTAIPEENYKFDHWELNGTFYSDQLTVEVTMDNNYELKAFFEYLPPLSVSISPPSTTIYLGESVTFTASPSGGVAPYSYQWYVNSNPVPGATSDTWTFTPSAAGIYYVHVVVTDSENQTAQSSASRVVVQEKVPTVGGTFYPVTFTPEPENSPGFPLTLTLIMVGIALSVFAGARKLKKSK